MKRFVSMAVAVAMVMAFCPAFSIPSTALADESAEYGTLLKNGTDGGVDWAFYVRGDSDGSHYDTLVISPASNPESGFQSGVMKDYAVDNDSGRQSNAPWNVYATFGDLDEDLGVYLEYETLGYNEESFLAEGADYAQGLQIEQLIIEDGVKTIGANAFAASHPLDLPVLALAYDCTTLGCESVQIASSVTSIGDRAFYSVGSGRNSAGYDLSIGSVKKDGDSWTAAYEASMTIGSEAFSCGESDASAYSVKFDGGSAIYVPRTSGMESKYGLDNASACCGSWGHYLHPVDPAGSSVSDWELGSMSLKDRTGTAIDAVDGVYTAKLTDGPLDYTVVVDGATVTYSVDETYNDYAEIDAGTGRVTLKKVPPANTKVLIKATASADSIHPEKVFSTALVIAKGECSASSTSTKLTVPVGTKITKDEMVEQLGLAVSGIPKGEAITWRCNINAEYGINGSSFKDYLVDPTDGLGYAVNNVSSFTVVKAGLHEGQLTFVARSDNYEDASVTVDLDIVKGSPVLWNQQVYPQTELQELSVKAEETYKVSGSDYDLRNCVRYSRDVAYPDLDKVTVSSADPSIATVDSSTGLLTGVKPGTTTITFAWEGNDDVEAGSKSVPLTVQPSGMPEDVVMSFSKDSKETRTYVTLGKTSDPQIVVPVYQTGENSSNVTWIFSVLEGSANIIDKVQAVDDPEDSAHVADVYLKGGLEGLGEGRIQFATSKVVDGEGNEIYAGATRNMTVEVAGKTAKMVFDAESVMADPSSTSDKAFVLNPETYGTWKAGGFEIPLKASLVDEDGNALDGFTLSYHKCTRGAGGGSSWVDGDDTSFARNLTVKDGVAKITGPERVNIAITYAAFVDSESQVYAAANNNHYIPVGVEVGWATPEIDIACDAALQMRPGESKDIGATSAATDDGATIQYASDNEEVAKVVDGAIQTVGVGRATVTVSTTAGTGTNASTADENKTISVMVKNDQTLMLPDGDALAIGYGEAKKIGAESSNSDAQFEFKSSDKNVATVDADGTVHGAGAGQAKVTVTAKSTDEYFAASKEVAVTVEKAEQVITVPEKLSVEAGKTTPFGATSNADSDGATLVYESSDEAVAKVDADGTVTGVAVGTATLSVKSEATANYKAAESKTVTVEVTEAKAPAEEDDTPDALAVGSIVKVAASDMGAAGSVKITSTNTVTLNSIDKAAKGTAKVNQVTIGGKKYAVTAIKAKAFKSAKVSKVVLGKKVKTIGASSFANCAKLSSVSGGANVTSIGKLAFSGCKKLKGFTIGKKVKKVGAKAFKGCKKLKTIVDKSSYLTKKATVKNCLKGSSVKTVKVKSAKKKQAVKKAFKKWAGKKGLQAK